MKTNKFLSRSSALTLLAGTAAFASVTLAATFASEAASPPNALVMAWNIDAISTFDPAQIGEVVTNEIVQNTCDPLVDFDPKDETKILPRMAKSWDVSEDGLQITFHLQDNLKFDNGDAAVAADLAWSMQRAVKLGFGNAATLTEYGFTKDNVDSAITAPDDKTVVFKLDKPYPVNLILSAIAANRVSILLNQKVLMANQVEGDMGNKYLATRTECVGPYKLMRWNPAEVVLLQASDNYWGEAPKLKQVLIRHVSEAGTQRLLLEKGDIDIARDLTPEDLKDLEAQDKVAVSRALKPTLFYWNFNNADPLFNNEKVRHAMRYLIDYDGLAKTVMHNVGVPRASFVQLGAFGALDEKEGQPFTLDVDKAKALLAEAGHPDGFETTMFIGTAPYAAPIAQSIQDAAAKAGVKIKIERMANAQLFSRIRGREFQTSLMGWATGVPDAHGNASRQIFNPDNRMEAKQTMYPSWRASYFDEAVNKEVDAALFEKDEAKRAELYHALQKEMMEKGPQAYMFQIYNVAGINKGISNWEWNGFRTYYDTATK
ncbi:ABC transporter substrate-binding protein [Pseudochrobactrum sp. sp1633]|uniref:ABC transporter substrate-binding protein n=1 Tax=Pseudochrobactrum sp. sp1633 TaxID=3036706 RepID=UPI0025A52E61|nr:ABC transporter substrate-binding protein [Pseudochrobactrum sp. sp1633]MDM8346088.1 ABC transporter substrate-binding protein [Pseudochrobactrum sp. sp1633]HWD13908.1 ABC transporter substrate-binding protein [Pseudochrobactrum sp.]